MTKDGIVFAKWWPATESIKNASTWEIDLILEDCNTYGRFLP